MAAFCLLHGAWHEPSCWDPLRKVPHERGHETAAPDLPLHDPAAGYPERVRPAIDAVARFDEPAVVVGHSQSSGLAPLVAAARPAAKVVYLCSMPSDAYRSPALPTRRPRSSLHRRRVLHARVGALPRARAARRGADRSAGRTLPHG